jgi:cobalt-zinc-cadmium efflux system protein
MRAVTLHPETHLVSRIGWLRAAVLGANVGFVIVEAAAGFWTGSLALLADAAHTRTDVADGPASGVGGTLRAAQSPGDRTSKPLVAATAGEMGAALSYQRA